MVEKLLYGRKNGQPEYMEELLLTRVERLTPAAIDRVKEMARRDGFVVFRIGAVDIGAMPDFIGTINKNWEDESYARKS